MLLYANYTSKKKKKKTLPRNGLLVWRNPILMLPLAKIKQKNPQFSFLWFQPRQFCMTSPQYERQPMNYLSDPKLHNCEAGILTPAYPNGLLLREQDVLEAATIPSH